MRLIKRLTSLFFLRSATTNYCSVGMLSGFETQSHMYVFRTEAFITLNLKYTRENGILCLKFYCRTFSDD